ncbi:Cys-Gln thioester bond-forming surface protein [Erysipelothrix sp. HDW6C]|uniref:LPXTG cell wall anchor domain-containing protein n=1 Tax=Erysipelothrix sp. HDW6C TaxID=2714930 RepID=UPI001409EBA1|nr:LPXTG cell wall anchor domain-containing protein [Erysipelothrix sp. HDW6C]QIK70715.1 Cys-Gln thioester bond-forming surface protein [Erysipelothrix sp. HDW6C]
MRKYRIKIKRLRKAVSTLSITIMTAVLLLTGMTSNISAGHDEIYTNQDKSAHVIVNRTLSDDELTLSFQVQSDDSVEILDITKENVSIKNDGIYQDKIVGQNGDYKYIVKISRQLLVEEDDEVVKTIDRDETFEFTVSIDEISVVRGNDGITESEEVTENAVEQEDYRTIKLDEVMYTVDGLDVVAELDYIPDMEDVLNLPQGYRAIITLEGNTLIVKNSEELQSRLMENYASGAVTTGSVLSSGVSFYWKANTSYYWEDIAFTEITVNGQVAYCIEPSVLNVSTSGATGTDFSSIGEVWVMSGNLSTQISNDTKRAIELISNYGYAYPGHQTQAYRWATQILIFEEIGWGFYSYGSLNPESEINEIKNLITTHSNRPTWHGNIKEVLPNETVTLTDPSLPYFDIAPETVGLQIISKTGTTITVKVISDNAKLILEKKRGSEKGTSFVYSDGLTQKVGYFKLMDPGFTNISFKLLKSTITFNKTDDTGRPVAGLGIEASYSQDFSVLIGRYTTDSNGSFKITDREINRTLYYREYSAPEGIVIDPTIKAFTPTGVAHTINIVNDVRQLLIGKVSPEGDPLQATFELYRNYYSENPELVTTVTTSELDGLALIDYLDKGLYTAKEIWVQEPYYVDVNNNTQDIIVDDIRGISKYEIEFTNEKVTGEYVIEKKDAKNGVAIEGVEYGIYDITDLQLDEDTELTYADVKALEAYETKLTNELGGVTFDALDISRKWVVIELSAPYGYVVDETLNYVEFEYVDCDTPVITHVAELLNERLQVTVKGVKVDSVTNSQIISKFFVLQLKDSEGNIVPIDHKDEDGTHYWKVDALEFYELSEVNAPIGYILSTEIKIVDTYEEKADHLYTIEFTNDAEPVPLPQTGIADNNLMMLALLIIVLGAIFVISVRRSKLKFSTDLSSFNAEVPNALVHGTTQIKVNDTKIETIKTSDVNNDTGHNQHDKDSKERQERPSHEKTRRME